MDRREACAHVITGQIRMWVLEPCPGEALRERRNILPGEERTGEKDAETTLTQTSEGRLGKRGRPALVARRERNQAECGELTRSDISFLLRV